VGTVASNAGKQDTPADATRRLRLRLRLRLRPSVQNCPRCAGRRE
jgi:hypothetical protein